MKQRLPTELQKHLKKKLFNLLSYYQPEWGKQLLKCSDSGRKLGPELCHCTAHVITTMIDSYTGFLF